MSSFFFQLFGFEFSFSSLLCFLFSSDHRSWGPSGEFPVQRRSAWGDVVPA